MVFRRRGDRLQQQRYDEKPGDSGSNQHPTPALVDVSAGEWIRSSPTFVYDPV